MHIPPAYPLDDIWQSDWANNNGRWRLKDDPVKTRARRSLPPADIHTPDSGQPGHEEFSMQIHSIQDAYYDATWRDHALFFQLGEHVGGDRHLRRYQFTNGSYVVIQAHVPKLTCTSESDAMVASGFFGGIGTGIVVAICGMAQGGAGGGLLACAVMLGIGALAGGVVGAVMADQARPYDAAWQGYTVTYYEEGSTQPWSWYRFYGWMRSDKPVTGFMQGNETDPKKFSDFADALEGTSWHRWDTLRPTEVQPKEVAKSADPAEHVAADRLVQAIGSFAAPMGRSAAFADHASSGGTLLRSAVMACDIAAPAGAA